MQRQRRCHVAPQILVGGPEGCARPAQAARPGSRTPRGGERRPAPRAQTPSPDGRPARLPGRRAWAPALASGPGPAAGAQPPAQRRSREPRPGRSGGHRCPGGPIPDGARPGPGCGLACGTPADLPPEAAALARDALPPRLASTLTGGGGPEGSEPGALHLWARRAPACRRAPPQASSGKYPAENTLLETEEILLGRIPPSSPSLPRLLPSPREKGNSTSTPGRELWFPQAFPNPH